MPLHNLQIYAVDWTKQETFSLPEKMKDFFLYSKASRTDLVPTLPALQQRCSFLWNVAARA